MTKEDISDSVLKALKVKCEFRNIENSMHVTTENLYPIPMVGDVVTFPLVDDEMEVVYRVYEGRASSWNDYTSYVLYVRLIK